MNEKAFSSDLPTYQVEVDKLAEKIATALMPFLETELGKEYAPAFLADHHIQVTFQSLAGYMIHTAYKNKVREKL